jgi:hypothetical protein
MWIRVAWMLSMLLGYNYLSYYATNNPTIFLEIAALLMFIYLILCDAPRRSY